VLPAATYLETEDFYRAYGTYYRLAQAFAQRTGLEDRVFRMSQTEL
jgi:anaerobic selenocysteine-containing dehydrogenase